MLAADQRLTDSEAFRSTARRGSRAASPALVVHLLVVPVEAPVEVAEPARIGFVVNRSVGNAVIRNQVKRRLRHLIREQLDLLPMGVDLVVRAKPAAAGLTSAQLGRELAGCLHRLLREKSL